MNDITTAMERIRQWYEQALGLSTSLNIRPPVHMAGEHGLEDYFVCWGNPE